MSSENTIVMSEDNGVEVESGPLLGSPKPKPKLNIFSISYPRRTLIQVVEAEEVSILKQYMIWAWGGSPYSPLICVAFSSLIYCTMEIIARLFTLQLIPLFEIALSRSIVLLALSVVWLRRNGQPLFAPTNILILRAVSGCISLITFIYCTQLLTQSQAILLSFSVPITATVAARFILHEKLKIDEIGGLACSFFGVIFIAWAMQTPERLSKALDGGHYGQKSYHTLAILMAVVYSVAAGISYCLVRAGAKATDQPVLTVFSFAVLAGPASALCTFVFQDFVVPSIYSLFLMIVLGILAFLAEITLARGLQLGKTSRVTNILYLEVVLFQILAMCSSEVVPSFARLVGCLLIFVSACCTLYFGPEKDDE